MLLLYYMLFLADSFLTCIPLLTPPPTTTTQTHTHTHTPQLFMPLLTPPPLPTYSHIFTPPSHLHPTLPYLRLTFLSLPLIVATKFISLARKIKARVSMPILKMFFKTPVQNCGVVNVSVLCTLAGYAGPGAETYCSCDTCQSVSSILYSFLVVR